MGLIRRFCIISSSGIADVGGVAESLRRQLVLLRGWPVEICLATVRFRRSTAHSLLSYTPESFGIKHAVEIDATDLSSDSDANVVKAAGLLKNFLRENEVYAANVFYIGRAALVAAQICDELGVPFIASARGSDIERGRFDPVRILTISLIADRAFSVTSVTQGISEIIHRMTGRKSRVIYNSCLLSSSKEIPRRSTKRTNEPLMILIDGSDSEKKGLAVALEAASGYSSKDIRFRVLGISDSDAHKLGLPFRVSSPQVEFLGQIDPAKVVQFIQSADVYIQASPTEGCPNMLLSALFSGCPVVASRAGVAREALCDGSTGLLLDPWSPEELKHAINDVRLDYSSAMQRAENARRLAEELFCPEKERNSWIDVYEAVMKNGSTGNS